MRKRVWCVFGLLITFFSVTGIHLGVVVRQKTAASVGFAQSSRTITVATVRGTIYDRDLQPLVNAKKEYRAALLPEESLLARVRPYMDTISYLSLLEKMQNQAPAVAALSGPVGIADGLALFFTPVRYADPQPATHLIGYLDSSGQNGVTGIEAAYDDLLSSCRGEVTVSYAVNGAGNYLLGKRPDVTNTLSRCAGGIALTLCRDVQMIVEETASKYLIKGAVVVLDPYSGELIASASFPGFHPESLAESIQEENGALINRTFSLYDCGSVFKIVTVAAALEQGITPERTYDCSGGMLVGNTLFHCHNRLGHQILDMQQAFAQSCNLYFIQLAQEIGGEALLEMAEAFGLTESIDLAKGLSAQAGVLPSSYELLTPAALANFSFGQGKLLLTPLHVARITATLANGGVLPEILLVKGLVDDSGILYDEYSREGERVLSQDTASILQTMMEKVVTEGTGQKATPKDTTAAGKTGTAQTGQINDGLPVIQSWFTGYFPAEDPRYVVTVCAEDADSTGVNASALFCEISNNLIEWEREQTG